MKDKVIDTFLFIVFISLFIFGLKYASSMDLYRQDREDYFKVSVETCAELSDALSIVVEEESITQEESKQLLDTCYNSASTGP